MTGKKRETAKLTRNELMERVWAAPLAVVAAELGITATGLAKMCDRLEVPRPRRSYWHLKASERAAVRPALAPAPAGASETVTRDGARQSRRNRKRLTLEERREQLLDEAAYIAVAEGVGEVSLKRLARDVGISEAQAHNCFARRMDVLVALARREASELEKARRGVVSRGREPVTAVVLSTITYLDEAQTRGPLLQALMDVPDVRRALREERDELRRRARAPVLASMQQRYGMSEAEARGANAILTEVVRRAGSLLANERISHAVAARLTLSIVLAGMRSNADTASRDRS